LRAGRRLEFLGAAEIDLETFDGSESVDRHSRRGVDMAELADDAPIAAFVASKSVKLHQLPLSQQALGRATVAPSRREEVSPFRLIADRPKARSFSI
jgi:hypothetical protein